ncbi:phenazine biosynthesis-like protein-domain-containing protein [Ilyonectria destructans]|nr:phenazine biosynthesis-like protein-domain-containing protein [Ilyonectria destructans]
MPYVVLVTLDVFTSKYFKGNQLAVVDVTKNELSDEDMQIMAREFNFSETVFLDRSSESPQIHIFTPMNEMDFAGHPGIGTGHVLCRRWLDSTPDRLDRDQSLNIETKTGTVAIHYDAGSEIVAAKVPHNVHLHSVDTPKETSSAPSLGSPPTRQVSP